MPTTVSSNAWTYEVPSAADQILMFSSSKVFSHRALWSFLRSSMVSGSPSPGCTSTASCPSGGVTAGRFEVCEDHVLCDGLCLVLCVTMAALNSSWMHTGTPGHNHLSTKDCSKGNVSSAKGFASVMSCSLYVGLMYICFDVTVKARSGAPTKV